MKFHRLVSIVFHKTPISGKNQTKNAYPTFGRETGEVQLPVVNGSFEVFLYKFKMPRYVAYLLFSSGLVLLTELIGIFFYDKMGHEEVLKEDDVRMMVKIDLKSEDSLIDKKIAERDTIAIQVISGDIVLESLAEETQDTYPTITTNEETKNIEKSLKISNIDLSDGDHFEQLKQTYLPQHTSELTKGQLRSDIVIRYYKHNPDGDKVYKLKQLKYYIHERDSEYVDAASNAIYYGENVNVEDIRIVVYTLIKNGIPIKGMRPSKYGKAWKSNSIEIGTDPLLFNENVLTLAAVRAFVH